MTPPLFACEGLSTADGLRGVGFEIDAGEVVGVVAPDGQTPRLLLDAICGLAPSRGKAWLAGRPLDLGDPAALARRGVARTFAEAPVAADLDPLAFVALAARLGQAPPPWRLLRRGRSAGANEGHDLAEDAATEAAASILAFVGLHPKAGPLGTLPAPERRLADLARALAQRPRLLLLERPFAGLSPAEAERWEALIRALARGKVGLLVADRDLERVAAVATRLLVLANGRLLADGPLDGIGEAPGVLAAFTRGAAA